LNLFGILKTTNNKQQQQQQQMVTFGATVERSMMLSG